MFSIPTMISCAFRQRPTFKLKLTFRYFCSSAVSCGKVPKNLKGKKVVSQEWIRRQLKDPYVRLSQTENYRCRSAFKLIEIDDQHKLLKPGLVVVDCGAAPGSWSQVSVQRVNSLGLRPGPVGQVIGVDLQDMIPVEGALFLSQCDFTSQKTQQRIMQLLQGKCTDVVLSDMAPSATGHKSLDHELIIKLCLSALKFSSNVLKEGGTFLCKVLQGNQQKQLETLAKMVFKQIRVVKPPSSRKDSAEIFLLCENFLGISR